MGKKTKLFITQLIYEKEKCLWVKKGWANRDENCCVNDLAISYGNEEKRYNKLNKTIKRVVIPHQLRLEGRNFADKEWKLEKLINLIPQSRK